MKNRVRILIFILVFVSVIGILYYNEVFIINNTIEEAILDTIYLSNEPNEREEITILHKIVNEKDAIVFFTDKEGKHFNGVYLHKNILSNWKLVYGNTKHNAVDESEKLGGIVGNFYVHIEDTPLPMFAGIITNDDIVQVRIIEKETNDQYNTKIIETEQYKIWFNYEDDFSASEYIIQGINKNGEVLGELLIWASDSQLKLQ